MPPIKINAVILLGTGWALKQVRQTLLLHGETLRLYVKKYHEHGIESLIRTHYKGRTSELAEAQEDQLRVVTAFKFARRPSRRDSRGYCV